MQHNILVALCCIIPFLSCKKDESPELSTGTYKSSGVITHNSLTLYTKDRAITDQMFISSFIQRRNLSGFSLKNGPDTTRQEISIQYIDSDSVIVETSYAGSTAGPLLYELANNTNNSSVLTSRDSFRQAYIAEASSINCNNASVKLRQYPNEPTCFPIAVSGGFSYICQARNKISITRHTHSITLPLFSFFFSSVSGTSFCTATVFNIPDFLREEDLSRLQTGDSVLIGVSSMNLLK